MQSIDELARTLQECGVVTDRALSSARESIGMDAEDCESVHDFIVALKNQDALTDFQASELMSGAVDRVVVGPYVLMNPIASGGMGVVFQAHHPMMNQNVALKFVRPTMEYDAKLLRRFQREVQTASKLVHPRIVRALNAGVHKGAPYLVMDYVDGPDLSRLVHAKGQLKLNDAIELTRQIAEGLHYAHGQGVVHRDIKPNNVLYDSISRSIKLLDMGLASIISSDQQEGVTKAGQTESGQVLGTADYLAPEQYVDASSVGPAADIYSLGCTLHFLLKGFPPYRDRGKAHKSLAHLSDPIPSLSDDMLQVPEEVQSVFQRMMAKAPEDRYPTAADLINDLQSLQTSGVVGDSSAILDSDFDGISRKAWAESGANAQASTVLLKNTKRTGKDLLVASGILLLFAVVAAWQSLSGFLSLRSTEPDASPESTISVNLTPKIDYIDVPALDQVQWPVELIPYVYPDRDTLSGNGWQRTEVGLMTGSGRATLLAIQHPIPEQYRLSMVVRRVAGDAPLYVGLPIGSTHAYVMLDRKGTSAVGLSENDRIEGIVSTIAMGIDETHTIVLEVTSDAIRVNFDGDEATSFLGDTSTMRLPDAFAIGETCEIFVGANNWSAYLAQFEFQSIVLEPIPPSHLGEPSTYNTGQPLAETSAAE